MARKLSSGASARDPAAVLSRQSIDYAMEALLNPTEWTIKDMRREYSRLRKIANRRLEALGRSEFSLSKAYQENKAGFAPLSKKASRREVAAELKQLTRFVSAKSSSVTGQRAIQKQVLNSLREHGYNIKKEDLRGFGMFMDFVRENYSELYFASDEVVEMFESTKRIGLSPNDLIANFKYWKEHEDELNSFKGKVKPKKGKRTISSEDLAAELGLTDYKKKRNVNLDNWYKRKQKEKGGSKQ